MQGLAAKGANRMEYVEVKTDDFRYLCNQLERKITIVGFNWSYVAAIVFCLAVGWYAYIALFPPRTVIDQPHRSPRPAPTPIQTGNARLACVAGFLSIYVALGVLVVAWFVTAFVRRDVACSS